MAERTVELDTPTLTNPAEDAVRAATERAERAEAALAKLQAEKQPPSRSTAANTGVADSTSPAAGTSSAANPPANSAAPTDRGDATAGGEEELRKDPMMARLLDALAAGEDVGHYGRLTFAMVARHFLPHEQVLRYLVHDRDFSEEHAHAMLQQVEGRDYNPPKRERLLEWQSEQTFQFLNPNDPDSGNLYRNLKFPQEIYKHIEHYQEEKSEAA